MQYVWQARFNSFAFGILLNCVDPKVLLNLFCSYRGPPVFISTQWNRDSRSFVYMLLAVLAFLRFLNRIFLIYIIEQTFHIFCKCVSSFCSYFSSFE